LRALVDSDRFASTVNPWGATFFFSRMVGARANRERLL
jgi:hypothetical protein